MRRKSSRHLVLESLESRVALDAHGVTPLGDLPVDLPKQAERIARFSGETELYSYEGRALIVTADPSASAAPATTPGTPAFGVNTDGVAELIITVGSSQFRCTGSLLAGGQHVLTAAHCVSDSAGNLDADQVDVTWTLPDGPDGDLDEDIVAMTSTTVDVHPLYNGDVLDGNDIAVITLPSVADLSIPRYELYTGASEIDAGGGTVETIKVGYGRSGQGEDGDTTPSGTKRFGKNFYDTDATVFASLGVTNGDEQLAYDFDSGLPENDAFDFFSLGPAQTGVANIAEEVNSAPGDSGGPTFINDGGSFKIAGVTSYGFSLSFRAGPPPRSSDVDKVTNSSFGEFSVDMRVSSYSSYIQSIVASSNLPPIAHDDNDTTSENVSKAINVLENDDPVDGDTLSVIAVTDGTHGTVTSDATSVTYTPNLDFNGVDTFTYTVSDGNGGTDTGVVTITVTGENDAPVAVNDDDTAVAGGPSIDIDVLANDSDPEGDTLNLVSVDDTGTSGTVILAGNTVTYTPPAAPFTGDDTFTYTVSDGDLVHSATVTVTVTVTEAPLATPGAHVADLDAVGIKLSQGEWSGKVTITVHNETETPVMDATVHGTFTQNGVAVLSVTGVTDGNGQVMVNSEGPFPSKQGSATFTVDGITGVTAYVPSANHDPDGGDGTSIDLSKGGVTVASNINSVALVGGVSVLVEMIPPTTPPPANGPPVDKPPVAAPPETAPPFTPPPTEPATLPGGRPLSSMSGRPSQVVAIDEVIEEILDDELSDLIDSVLNIGLQDN